MEALKKKTELDYAMQMKLDDIATRMTPEQMEEVRGIEISKVSDNIYGQYGFDMDTLMDYVRHYKLMGHPEVKALGMKLGKQAAIQRRKAIFMRQMPSQEALKEIEAEAEAAGPMNYNQDGTLTFEDFLKSSSLVVKHTQKLTKEFMQQKVTERRRALKIKNNGLY